MMESEEKKIIITITTTRLGCGDCSEAIALHNLTKCVFVRYHGLEIVDNGDAGKWMDTNGLWSKLGMPTTSNSASHTRQLTKIARLSCDY